MGHRYVARRRFAVKSVFTQLWRQLRSPEICSQKQKTQGSCWWSSWPSLKPWGPGGPCVASGLREEDRCPGSGRQARGISSSSVFLFYSGLQLLRGGPPYYGGPSALLRLLIQMFISSRNTLPDTSRVWGQMSGCPTAQSVDTEVAVTPSLWTPTAYVQ